MNLEIMDYLAFADPKVRGSSTGNHAAVVFGLNMESDRKMQELASSIGAPATVFVGVSERLFDDLAPMPTQLRFFTPTMEESVCGHGTLAAIQALHDRDGLENFPHGFPTDPFRMELPLGESYVRFEDGLPWLSVEQIPQAAPLEIEREDVALALGLEPDDLHEDLPIMAAGVGRPKLVCGVPSTMFLDAIEPDLGRIAVLCEQTNTTGIVAFTFPGRYGCFTDSRHFSYQHSNARTVVLEDAATGNAHVALAAYLAANAFFDNGDHGFSGSQGHAMGRPSRIEVRCLIHDGLAVHVLIGGQVRKVEP